MIPKIIHQTWKTENIPEQWLDATNSCKNIHKDFKYILWTHKNMDYFVKKNYPKFYNTYIYYKYDIQRADAFRYLVLYEYGGIYLDLDILCKKNITKLLHYDIIFVKSYNVDIFTNSFFMVKPKHPFFNFCINKLQEYSNSYSYYGKHLHVMNSTGPFFLENRLKEYGKIPNMYVLSKKEFAGDCTICNENNCKGGDYFNHISGKSWHSIDSIIYNGILCNYKKIIGIIIFLLIVYFFIKYKNKIIKMIHF